MGDPSGDADPAGPVKNGRRAITVWLPVELLDDVQKQRRTPPIGIIPLTEYVRRALASFVEMNERYAPLRQARRR